MNANKKQQVTHLQVTNELMVAVIPNEVHQFVMTSNEVAHGYDCSSSVIRSHKTNNPKDLIEGKHFVKGVHIIDTLGSNVQPHQTYWTKRGIVRLGFFIRTEKARLFRDWAEDLIMNELEGKKRGVKLHDHEKPLFEILKKWLVRGDIKRVATKTKVGAGSVSRVKRGIFRSQRIMEALIDQCKYNKTNNIVAGYQNKYTQLSLNFFNPQNTLDI